MRSALLLTTAAALMIGVGFGAQAGASFTTITDPNDTDGSTIASGINDSGQIVGSYLGNNPSYSPSNPSAHRNSPHSVFRLPVAAIPTWSSRVRRRP